MDRNQIAARAERNDVPVLGKAFLMLAVLSILAVLSLSALVVHLQDRNSINASVDLVKSALATRQERQETILQEYGYWDQAVDAIAKPASPDMDWVESEFGVYLHEQAGIEFLHVYDANNIEVVRVENGDLRQASGLPAGEADLASLIAAARQFPENELSSAVSTMTLRGDRIFLTSAFRMTTYDDDIDIPTRHILVFASAMDDEFLASLEQASLVRDMEIAARTPDYGEASTPLNIPGQSRTLRLIWRPDMPGTEMLPWMLAAITGFIVLVAAAGAIFMRRMTRHAIELSEARQISDAASRQKSELLANMSHELRTPLNAVIGFADIMRNQMLGPVGNSKYLDYATDIRNSGEHLLSLVNGLLDMSKIEADRYELDIRPVNVEALIRQCRKMVEQLAEEKRITIDTNLTGAPENVQGDEKALRQVLINLFSNAVKFTPDGGSVNVTTQQIESRVEFAFTDTGIGIAARDLDQIMEPFYQVKARPDGGQRGTGLGLSVSRKLVELMGGDITIESEVGIGTTVTISLPAAPPAIAHEPMRMIA